MAAEKVPLRHQIEEVERELVMRRQVYPGLVRRKTMRQGEADLHMGRMEAVLATLRWLQENEERIKGALGSTENGE